MTAVFSGSLERRRLKGLSSAWRRGRQDFNAEFLLSRAPSRPVGFFGEGSEGGQWRAPRRSVLSPPCSHSADSESRQTTQKHFLTLSLRPPALFGPATVLIPYNSVPSGGSAGVRAPNHLIPPHPSTPSPRNCHCRRLNSAARKSIGEGIGWALCERPRQNALHFFFPLLKLPQFLNLNWTVGVAHPPLYTPPPVRTPSSTTTTTLPLLGDGDDSPAVFPWLWVACRRRRVQGSVSAGVTPGFSARVTGTMERGVGVLLE